MSNETANLRDTLSRSAIMELPAEARRVVRSIIWNPRFLARLLREEAESAEYWTKAHADGKSLTQRKDASGSYITKRDSYAAKAKMYHATADVLDPPTDPAN